MTDTRLHRLQVLGRTVLCPCFEVSMSAADCIRWQADREAGAGCEPPGGKCTAGDEVVQLYKHAPNVTPEAAPVEPHKDERYYKAGQLMFCQRELGRVVDTFNNDGEIDVALVVSITARLQYVIKTKKEE